MEHQQITLDGREIAQERPQEPREDIPAGPTPRLFDAPRTMRGQIAMATDPLTCEDFCGLHVDHEGKCAR